MVDDGCGVVTNCIDYLLTLPIVHHLSLIIHHSPSIIHHPSSIIHHPPPRIALSSIAQKLRMDDGDDVRGVVAKAIRDGVIDATLDVVTEVVRSRDVQDV